jgi:hypothetical protein
MKRKLLLIAFTLNILAFVYFIVPFLIIVLFKVDQFDVTYLVYFSIPGRSILIILLIGIIYLWIDNLRFIINNKKEAKHLLLIIFLHWIYSPIFFIKHRKENSKI